MRDDLEREVSFDGPEPLVLRSVAFADIRRLDPNPDGVPGRYRIGGDETTASKVARPSLISGEPSRSLIDSLAPAALV